MINGIISVLVVFLLMGTGFYFTRTKKWVSGHKPDFFYGRGSNRGAGPCHSQHRKSIHTGAFKSSLWNLLIVACVMLLMHFLGRLLGNLMNLPKKKKGSFYNNLYL